MGTPFFLVFQKTLAEAKPQNGYFSKLKGGFNGT
jgi:hypothetical protein